MNDEKVKSMVEEIVRQLLTQESAAPTEAKACTKVAYVEDGQVPDLSAVDFREIIDVPNPENLEVFREMRRKTVARVGVWRAGPRYRTNTYLRFCSDHAVAMDAVFNEVSEEFLKELGLKTYVTLCDTKALYLTRPDLGRQFDDEVLAQVKQDCINNPDVQILIADGLSSTAVEANMRDMLPALMQGLAALKLNVGTPIFVKHGRVGAMDPITETLGAKVTVNLLGERPGLATGESLSAYMTYGGYIGIPEAGRTVVSNIHRGGTNPVEAGAFVAELCGRMLKEKASGLDLKL